jgi:hypothetical protein
MDFTPAVSTGAVTVEPAAAKSVRTVADSLSLPEWPAEQLRLVVERWEPAAEVRIERMRWRPTGASGQVRSSVGFVGPYGCTGFFLAGGEGSATPTSHSAASRCPGALKQNASTNCDRAAILGGA